MTSDFISFLSWKQTDEGLKYCNYTNSSEISKIIDLLNDNSDYDISYLKAKYNTDNLKGRKLSEIGEDSIVSEFLTYIKTINCLFNLSSKDVEGGVS